jgi:hypothetical protein
MNADIDKLILEAQRAKLIERRTEPRHPFVRPVQMYLGKEAAVLAFSKDMSKQGIGVITDMELEAGTIAVLTIHSTSHTPVTLKCELRWSDKFGKGWFLTGWKFLSSAAVPRGV